MYTYTDMIIYGVYLHLISFFEVRHHMCVYIYNYIYIYIYLHVISKKHEHTSCPLSLPEISNLSIPFLPKKSLPTISSVGLFVAQEAKKSSKDEGRTSSKEEVKVEDLTDAWPLGWMALWP